MKEDKEYIERMGPEWGRFWITSGMEVYHRQMVSEGLLRDNGFKMIVDKVIKRQIKNNEESYFRIVGIKCHWFNGTFQSGLFHTKELYPANVVDNGMLQDWLER